MNQYPFGSPRSTVAGAITVLAFLIVLLVGRAMNADYSDVQATTAASASATTVVQVPVPAPKPLVLEKLTIPCWSCPEANASPLGFRTDLDLLAPLGTGGRNAAEWYAAFTQPDGSRAAQAEAIMNRRINHPTLGKVLPPDDPFLAEAQPWLDQATMRFYPDVYALEGFQTKVPNLMLALTLQ